MDIMAKYPQVFDDMYIALVDAGEQGGLLSEVLERESIFGEISSQIQLVSAMAYPIGILFLLSLLL